MTPTIREERPGDFDEVHTIHAAAFGRELEAKLADDLRPIADPLVSLVAELDGRIVGHIIGTPVTVDGYAPPVPAMAFGPLGVVPEHQRDGIGGALMRAAIEACRALGVPFVVLLGHPEYYPRFGFRPAFDYGLTFAGQQPHPAAMALELKSGAMTGLCGEIHYLPPFNET